MAIILFAKMILTTFCVVVNQLIHQIKQHQVYSTGIEPSNCSHLRGSLLFFI